MAGGPTDCLLRESVGSDQGWRVALAAWPVFDVEISTDDMLNGLKQFLHGSSMTGSEIQSVAGSVVQEMHDRAGMCIGKIENVDEVTHAGPVTRVVVGA